MVDDVYQGLGALSLDPLLECEQFLIVVENELDAGEVGRLIDHERRPDLLAGFPFQVGNTKLRSPGGRGRENGRRMSAAPSAIHGHTYM